MFSVSVAKWHRSKRRHDWVGKRIHWDFCRKYGIKVREKWYEHKPESVVENENCKILWDFNIQTDHVIEARRPDMIVVDKVKKTCTIIDFAIPYNIRVNNKLSEKYQDLARELRKSWNMKVKVIPIIIGTLGTTPREVKKRLEVIGIETRVKELQKTVIIHSARIFRKVLEI